MVDVRVRVGDESLTPSSGPTAGVASERHRSFQIDLRGECPASDVVVVVPTTGYVLAKRALDVFVAGLGLLALMPLLLVVAAFVAMDGASPLFSQERVGRDGVSIRVLKFRTMCSDAHDRLARCPELYAEYVANDFKLPAEVDPRVSRLGRLLRKTSIDELPQLWNVLRGDMSLVGPRPVVAEELDLYGEYRADYLRLKPGVTGIWQVSGRSTVKYPERAVLEASYGYSFSLRQDLRILVQTVPAVLGMEGSW